jgi:hypothetical protein
MDPHPQIWKVPVTQDLETLDSGTSGIKIAHLSSEPPLAGYDHYGDLDYYDYKGTGYLLVPANNDSGSKALVVFKASDLSYVGHTGLDANTSASWCAVDRASPEGYVYFPRHEYPTRLMKYELKWDDLPGALTLGINDTININDENDKSLKTGSDQGGEFTPSGELFYMVTGTNNPDEDDPHPDEEGIHVFDTQTWKRIKHSTRCDGYFNYCYDPAGSVSEEPEGITIWDLDGAGAPGISGQVHVVLLDNEPYDFDQVYIKHYRGYKDIHVNGLYSGSYQDGTPPFPFRTLTAAAKEAWNGAILHVKSMCYPEAVTFNKKMEFIPVGGPVVIGVCSK